VQVDPIEPTLKAPESKRSKLEHEKTLPNFGFKFELRRYIQVAAIVSNLPFGRRVSVGGRGLHSHTAQLNLSRSRQ